MLDLVSRLENGGDGTTDVEATLDELAEMGARRPR